ncbi:MAG: hypothetical protein ACOCUV_03020 [bacterium]
MNDYTLKGYLLGLMIECPVGKSLAGCPLSAVRNVSRIEQMNFITDLSLDEAAKISNHHRECMAMRLEDSTPGYF